MTCPFPDRILYIWESLVKLGLEIHIDVSRTFETFRKVVMDDVSIKLLECMSQERKDRCEPNIWFIDPKPKRDGCHHLRDI